MTQTCAHGQRFASSLQNAKTWRQHLQMLLLLLNCNVDREEQQRPKDTGNDRKLKSTLVKYAFF